MTSEPTTICDNCGCEIEVEKTTNCMDCGATLCPTCDCGCEDDHSEIDDETI